MVQLSTRRREIRTGQRGVHVFGIEIDVVDEHLAEGTAVSVVVTLPAPALDLGGVSVLEHEIEALDTAAVCVGRGFRAALGRVRAERGRQLERLRDAARVDALRKPR